MNNIYESILEKLLLTESYQVSRKQNFQKLYDELKKPLDDSSMSIAALADNIYKNILRTSSARDNLNINSDTYKNLNSESDDFKTAISNAIKDFKNQTDSLDKVSAPAWFQVNFNNAPGKVSMSAGMSDDDRFFNGRTHNIYFTFKHNDLSKNSLSKDDFASHIKNMGKSIKEFAEWCNEFNANKDENKGIGIKNFKTNNILTKENKIDKFVKYPSMFIPYFTEADNFKIYLTGINRQKDQNDVKEVVKVITDKVVNVFKSNGFESNSRERGSFGVDFAITTSDKKIKRTSFGQVVSFLLANTLSKNEAIKKLVLDENIDIFQKNFFILVKKAEDCIANSSNSSAIARIILNPHHKTSFMSAS